MNNSGIKRGLATVAVSALAVSGLGVFAGSANAAPLADQAGGADQVVLYSQFAGSKKISAADDGNNSSISLVAGAGEDITAVSFEYSLNGTTWQAVPGGTSVARDAVTGAFEVEWAPVAELAGATLSVRAVAFKGAAVADTDVRSGLSLVGGSATDVVDVDNTELRIFQQPYGGENNKHQGVVRGKTSAADNATVVVSARSGGATGTASAAVKSNAFEAVLDIAGYAYGSFANPANNQIVIGAELGTDDAKALQIVRQAITAVNVTGGAQAPLGGTTTVEVEVLDQAGEPIVGAQVYDSNGNRLIGYTGIDGKVKDAAAAAGSHTYYANVTADTSFNAGVDVSASITIPGYVATPASISATSKLGSAFADNEYTDGDIVVEVKDQNGNPVANRKVQYKWAVPTTPASSVPATGYSEATTDAAGKAVVEFPVSAPSGAATLSYRVPADANGDGAVAEKSDLTVIAGKAVVELTPAEDSTAAGTPGSELNFTATVKLDDAANTVLANREVVFEYTRGVEKAPADEIADAGIVPQSGTEVVLSRTVKTDPNGVATVTVKDAAVADAAKVGSELGGKLTATALGESKQAKVDFKSGNSLSEVKLEQTSNYLSQPGRPALYKVVVKNDDNTPRANAEIAVSIDKGYLYKTTAAGAPVEDAATAISGDFEKAASQSVVKTDANGEAYIAWGIERDEDFDDDGALVANLAINYGGVEQKDAESWFSGNDDGSQLDPQTGLRVIPTSPVNVGSVDVEFAEEQQQSSILPKAQAERQTVKLDVFVTDQYGNLVKTEVQLSDNTNQASHSSWPTSQFSTDISQASAWADREANINQRIFAQAGGVADATPVDIEWYKVDLAGGDVTISRDVDDTVKVNTAVTETVTVADQFGQGVSDISVEFLRSGPAPQDGDVNYSSWTNRQGVATYNFVGTQAGVASITAVVRDGSNQLAKLTDTVTFEAEAPVGPVEITAELSGNNNGKKADKLTVVTTPAAEGAKAVLQFQNAKGKWKKVEAATLNAKGKVKFTVADENGKAKTAYRVKVKKTASTKAATSNTKSVR